MKINKKMSLSEKEEFTHAQGNGTNKKNLQVNS